MHRVMRTRHLKENIMSKTKEFDRLADKASKEAIKEIYKICDWTLSGDEIDELLGSTPLEYNEAHSYLVSLTAAKVAE